MKNTTVRVGEEINSISNVDWDGRGNSIMCDIKYISNESTKTLTLSENLDRQFNITEPNYFLIGGFFEMMLDPQKRIIDWSIRTNPKQWIRGERGFEEAAPATAFIDADFDEDARAYIDEPTKFYEPVRGALYLSWAQSSTWYEIAPGMALGVTEQNHLAELRLDGFFLPEVEQKVERLSLWKKLRQLI